MLSGFRALEKPEIAKVFFQAFPGKVISAGSGEAASGADDHGIGRFKSQVEFFQFRFIGSRCAGDNVLYQYIHKFISHYYF